MAEDTGLVAVDYGKMVARPDVGCREFQVPIKTQTDSMVQTDGPIHGDLSPAFTVAKVAKSPTTYEITFGADCANIVFDCVPSIAEERAKFAAFVNSP